MRRRPRPGPAGAALGALLMALTWGFTPAGGVGGAAGSVCDRMAPGTVEGTVADPALTEVSGLAASQAHPEVLWAHGDSGAGPSVHALSPSGAALGAYEVPGAQALDWEDMAVGPGPDPARPLLYLGDVGDNGAERASVTVYRAEEPAERPDGTGGQLALVDATEVTYPEGPADVEALLVDPLDGDLLLLTKDLLGATRVLLVPAASLGRGAPVAAVDVGGFQVPLDLALGGGLPGTAVTGADVSPDGRLVLVRTYQAVLAFDRPAGAPLAEALTAPPCTAPQRPEPQGEAIAVTARGDAYVTVSEGAAPPVHRFAISAAPDEASGEDRTATTERPADPASAGDDEGAVPIGTVVAVGVGLGLVLTVVALVVLRRRR